MKKRKAKSRGHGSRVRGWFGRVKRKASNVLALVGVVAVVTLIIRIIGG